MGRLELNSLRDCTQSFPIDVSIHTKTMSDPITFTIRSKKKALNEWLQFYLKLSDQGLIKLEKTIGPRKVAGSQRSYYLKITAQLPDKPDEFARKINV